MAGDVGVPAPDARLPADTWAAASRPAGEDDARLLEWELWLPTAEDAAGAEQRLADAGHPVTPLVDGLRAEDPWGTTLRVRFRDGR